MVEAVNSRGPLIGLHVPRGDAAVEAWGHSYIQDPLPGCFGLVLLQSPEQFYSLFIPDYQITPPGFRYHRFQDNQCCSGQVTHDINVPRPRVTSQFKDRPLILQEWGLPEKYLERRDFSPKPLQDYPDFLLRRKLTTGNFSDLLHYVGGHGDSLHVWFDDQLRPAWRGLSRLKSLSWLSAFRGHCWAGVE